MKKVLILASGGLDSTYLIYKNLKEGNSVKVIYVEIKNNALKVKLEKQKLTLILEEFKKKFGSENLSYNSELNNLSVDINTLDYMVDLVQVPIWILGCLYNCDGIDEIQIGYVLNDCAISYLDDIQNIFKSYQGITNSCKFNKIQLVFPLKKITKVDLFNELPTCVSQYITFCENPIYKSKQVLSDIKDCNPEEDKIVDGEEGLNFKEGDLGELVPCGECAICKRYKMIGLYDRIVKNDLTSTEEIQVKVEGKSIEKGS